MAKNIKGILCGIIRTQMHTFHVPKQTMNEDEMNMNALRAADRVNLVD